MPGSAPATLVCNRDRLALPGIRSTGLLNKGRNSLTILKCIVLMGNWTTKVTMELDNPI
ncbi:MAG: hypothetical protein HYY23_19655 [Verrucomicrobia bacterium]|nr:hypothetical protein [Verrucomicrobiota bacterium]